MKLLYFLYRTDARVYNNVRLLQFRSLTKGKRMIGRLNEVKSVLSAISTKITCRQVPILVCVLLL